MRLGQSESLSLDDGSEIKQENEEIGKYTAFLRFHKFQLFFLAKNAKKKHWCPCTLSCWQVWCHRRRMVIVIDHNCLCYDDCKLR